MQTLAFPLNFIEVCSYRRNTNNHLFHHISTTVIFSYLQQENDINKSFSKPYCGLMKKVEEVKIEIRKTVVRSSDCSRTYVLGQTSRHVEVGSMLVDKANRLVLIWFIGYRLAHLYKLKVKKIAENAEIELTAKPAKSWPLHWIVEFQPVLWFQKKVAKATPTVSSNTARELQYTPLFSVFRSESVRREVCGIFICLWAHF